MKVLYISNSSQMSGAPAALFNLVKGFAGKGGEAAVILPDDKGPLFKKLNDAGISCYIGPSYRLTIYPKCLNPLKRSRRMAELKDRSKVIAFIGRIMDEFQPDIVHTNVGPLDYALELCRQRNIPHVWHLREYQDKDFGMTFYPSKERFRELIHSQWNHNIAITQGIFNHWELGHNDRVIYDGVYDEIPVPVEMKEKYFLYAARLEKAKGFAQLARAFRKFVKVRPDFSLKVAGESCGLYGLFWKAYCKLAIPKGSVQFLGVRDDVGALMDRAAAIVVPSRFEGFGFSTAEAMLHSCLVIGRDTAGTKEQFDNALRISGMEVGFRFKSLKSLLKQMNAVASGDDFSKMRAAGRMAVVESYGTDRYVSQVMSYYSSICTK